jgi:hypothetical protein
MDNIGIAYNADKSWPVANVTSGECYGGQSPLQIQAACG